MRSLNFWLVAPGIRNVFPARRNHELRERTDLRGQAGFHSPRGELGTTVGSCSIPSPQNSVNEFYWTDESPPSPKNLFGTLTERVPQLTTLKVGTSVCLIQQQASASACLAFRLTFGAKHGKQKRDQSRQFQDNLSATARRKLGKHLRAQHIGHATGSTVRFARINPEIGATSARSTYLVATRTVCRTTDFPPSAVCRPTGTKSDVSASQGTSAIRFSRDDLRRSTIVQRGHRRGRAPRLSPAFAKNAH